jgi:uncharacterized membrane protein
VDAPAPDAPGPAPRTPESDLETLLRLEREASRRRSPSERLSSGLLRGMGTLRFMIGHLVLFVVWIAWNTGLLGLRPFDPFPFGVFTLIVSAEGVFLAIFILISQNATNRLADRRAHLDLQITLLSERETTKALQILRAVADRVGAAESARDEETSRLAEATEVEHLARTLDQAIEQVKRSEAGGHGERSGL